MIAPQQMRHSTGIFSQFDIVHKFVLMVSVGLVILFVIMAFFLYHQEQNALNQLYIASSKMANEQQELDFKEYEKHTQDKVDRIITLVSQVAGEPILALDITTLTDYARSIKQDPGFTYVAFEDKKGGILASLGNKYPGDKTVEKEIKISTGLAGKIITVYQDKRFKEYSDLVKKNNKERLNVIKTTMDDTVNKALLNLSVSMVLIALCVGGLVYFMFKILVQKRLISMDHHFQDIAEGEGDLSKRIPVEGHDIIDRMAYNFNRFLSNIHNTMIQVNTAIEQLSQASDKMAGVTEQTHRGVKEQKNEVDMVVAAMNEMSATIQEVSNNAATAAGRAQHADKVASTGRQVVSKTIETIDLLATEVEKAAGVIGKLRQDSNSIGVILDVIRGIAEQTNLLALNAAIEAARAGDQGRGFAVVADEVRTLASRTQQSTQEIQQMIESLQTGAQNAVQTMEQSQRKAQASVQQAADAGTSLEEITTVVGAISEMNMQIASAVEEQTATTDSVNKNISNISRIAELTQEGANKTEKASEHLSQLSMTLQGIVGRFKL